MVRHCRSLGFEVMPVGRLERPSPGTELGLVIYAIGLTADFRSRPFDTVAAHVTVLSELLQDHSFESFLYMSSTRVYRGAGSTSEDAALCLTPIDPDRLYDTSKLAGEALCLSIGDKGRVVRLSNVYGSQQSSENFLPSLVHDVRTTGEVTIRSGRSPAKDYVHLDDACDAMVQIAVGGRYRIYNVASGINTSNADVARLLEAHWHAGVKFGPNPVDGSPLPIDVSRVRTEFGWSPRPLSQGFVDAFVTGGERG